MDENARTFLEIFGKMTEKTFFPQSFRKYEKIEEY
jgi:hypothetical protein